MFIGGAFQYRAYQPWIEAAQEEHAFHRGLAAGPQGQRLRIALEDALVLAQGLFDLVVPRQGLVVDDAQALGGLQLGMVEVADAVFAHQPGGFLGDAKPGALAAVLGVDAVVFAS